MNEEHLESELKDLVFSGEHIEFLNEKSLTAYHWGKAWDGNSRVENLWIDVHWAWHHVKHWLQLITDNSYIDPADPIYEFAASRAWKKAKTLKANAIKAWNRARALEVVALRASIEAMFIEYSKINKKINEEDLQSLIRYERLDENLKFIKNKSLSASRWVSLWGGRQIKHKATNLWFDLEKAWTDAYHSIKQHTREGIHSEELYKKILLENWDKTRALEVAAWNASISAALIMYSEIKGRK